MLTTLDGSFRKTIFRLKIKAIPKKQKTKNIILNSYRAEVAAKEFWLWLYTNMADTSIVFCVSRDCAKMLHI